MQKTLAIYEGYWSINAVYHFQCGILLPVVYQNNGTTELMYSSRRECWIKVSTFSYVNRICNLEAYSHQRTLFLCESYVIDKKI